MTSMWEWYFKKMPGNDKSINFWRARRVKGLGFYRCTDDYMFSLDFGTDAKLLEPGVLLEFEDKLYRVAAKQVAFIKKDDYSRTKRLSPIYHIYLEDADKRLHLYSDEAKDNSLSIKGERIKRPRGATTPEVKLPREIIRGRKPTKEEKLLERHEKAKAARKRAEERMAAKLAKQEEEVTKPVVKKRKKRRKRRKRKETI